MINRLSRLESSVTRLATILSNGKTPAQDDSNESPPAEQDDTLPKTISPSQSRTGPSPSSEPRATEELYNRPSKRIRLESPSSLVGNDPKREPDSDRETNLACPEAAGSEHDFTRATQFEARSFIQGALAETFQSISVDRRSVLEAALDFVGKMGHPPTRRPLMKSDKCGEEVADCIVPPSPEFFHMFLSGNHDPLLAFFSLPLSQEYDPETRRSDPRTYDLEYSTYMSRETLERMALAMHDKNEDDQTLIQYSICVNSCAATYLWNLPEEGQSVGMQHALDRSREDYMRRALTALNYISILEKPSLSLLQALLTGVSD